MSCQCRFGDAWRCAKDQRLTSITCICKCHEPKVAQAAPTDARPTNAEKFYYNAPWMHDTSLGPIWASAANESVFAFAEAYAADLRAQKETYRKAMVVMTERAENAEAQVKELELQVEQLVGDCQAVAADYTDAVGELKQAKEALADAKHIIIRFLQDLPTKRDWLDPDTEKIARKFLACGQS